MEDDSIEARGSPQRPFEAAPYSAFEALAELTRRLLACGAVAIVAGGKDGVGATAIAIATDSILAETPRDPRLLTDPVAVGDLGLSFYAGVPVRGADGSSLGTLAAVDPAPRKLSDHELETLKLAACVAAALLEPGEPAG